MGSNPIFYTRLWGYSLIGKAPVLHTGERGFDPHWLHQPSERCRDDKD